jgi:hypothetical protein
MSDYPTDYERLEVAEAEVERLTMMHLSAESELMTAQEREKMLRKEVLRLTAALAEMTTNYKWWWGRCEDAEARERALRAIPNAVRAGHSLPMQTHQAIDKINELMGKIE